MDLNLLFEADMNRREFLGFLGKAGAAAAGAPLDKLSQFIPSPSSPKGSTVLSLHVRFPGVWSQKGPAGDLSSDIKALAEGWKIFKTLSGAENVKVRDLNPYGSFHFLATVKGDVGEFVNKWGLKNLPEDYDAAEAFADREDWPHMTAAYSTNEDWFKNTPYGVLKASSNLRTSEGGMDSPAGDFAEAIQAFVDKTFDDYNIQFLDPEYFDPEGLEVLDNYGVNSKEIIELHKVEHAAFNKDQDEQRERAELRYRREKDRSQPREVGYEKESVFDPQSSRPAQELGPFESKLWGKLKLVV